jgi:hypothetical protein
LTSLFIELIDLGSRDLTEMAMLRELKTEKLVMSSWESPGNWHYRSAAIGANSPQSKSTLTQYDPFGGTGNNADLSSVPYLFDQEP